MKNLLYKEMKLSVSIATYLFPLLSALMLIPQYPYIVAFVYFFFPIQISFQMSNANRDMNFTAMLPIPRNYIVLGKVLMLMYSELIYILISLPFAILSSFVVNKGGNSLGLDANFALYGYVLIAMGMFNLGFSTKFFKTGYKLGVPFWYGIICFFVVVAVFETLVAAVPAVKTALDGLDRNYLWARLITFVVGIGLYLGFNVLSYKLSCKSYERVVI